MMKKKHLNLYEIFSCTSQFPIDLLIWLNINLSYILLVTFFFGFFTVVRFIV